MAADAVTSALAGAKVAGAKAEKDFPGKMAQAAGVTPAAERSASKPIIPEHEFSKAPYSLVGRMRGIAQTDEDAKGIASGIKWRAEQRKALQP